VLGVAVVLAWITYARFRELDRYLWTNSTHDRNAHYLYALRLATDARAGQVFRLLDDLNQARVWPPLHGVLAAVVLIVGGLDYRLAVLPSLAGWVGTVVFAFLLARRAVPRGGNWAGLVAAVFVLASPSHRAYATDVMLESLGACLSLACLYCYLVAVQSRSQSPWPGRILGLALTALFLHKYNYWLLVVLALGVTTVANHHTAMRETFAGFDWRQWLKRQWHRPLNYVLAIILGLIAAIYLRGDRPLVLNGRAISLYPPHNFIHAAYAVLFLRMVAWWRSTGKEWVKRFDGRVGQVVRWHLLPMAVWFLLPKHPSYFLWYLSLANASESQRFDLGAGVTEYTHWVVADYHVTAWSAVLAAFLAGAGLLCWRRLRPGGQAVLCFFVLALALTVAHPNRKGRNLHSWLASGWVTAGIGLAMLSHGRMTAGCQRLRPWLAGIAVGGLALAHFPSLTVDGHAPEGGPHPDRASLLDLTDYYLPDLDEAGRATVLATVPVKSLVQWTYLERHGGFDGLEDNWYGFGEAGAANRQGFQHWLQTTLCDTLIFFDRTQGAANWEDVPEVALHAELRELLLSQHVFQEIKRCDFPDSGCSVSVWQRKK
jgi:hypothetical protein